MVLSEDECILNGWNTHFQRLSTPDTGIENTEDPSAMECTLIEEILKDPKKRKEISDITTTTTEEAIQKLAKGKAPDHMGLTAEHFKKGGKTIANYTAALLKAAKKDYNIPEVLKTGLLTPFGGIPSWIWLLFFGVWFQLFGLFWMVTGLPIFRPLPLLMKLNTESALLD
jgi:hypothetical protein